jgi:hypothetical protein
VTEAAQPARATYEIVVEAPIDDALVESIGAHRFEPCRDRTVIVVDVIDRAHLHGVLTQLHDHNVGVVRVNPL